MTVKKINFDVSDRQGFDDITIQTTTKSVFSCIAMEFFNFSVQHY